MPTDTLFGTQDIVQKRNLNIIIKHLDALGNITVSTEYVEGGEITNLIFFFSLHSSSESQTITQTETIADTKTRREYEDMMSELGN